MRLLYVIPHLYVSHENCSREESKVGAIALWRQARVSSNRFHDWLTRNDEEDNFEVESARRYTWEVYFPN